MVIVFFRVFCGYFVYLKYQIYSKIKASKLRGLEIENK